MKGLLSKSAIVFLFFIALIACIPAEKEIQLPTTDLSTSPLIPLPQKVIPTNSAFALDNKTVIYTSNTSNFKAIGSFLSEKIKQKTGLTLSVNETSQSKVKRLIYIQELQSVEGASKESYTLRIKKDSIMLSSSTAAGAFRGMQTLRQLIPWSSNDTLTTTPLWLIPTGKITDAPNFEYRAAMLDVARHFFSVEEVKKYIDLLAYYKYNALHMHLSDDQGWRIEIKSWPKLTTVGGLTEVGGGAGGFYTQEDFKEIVAYAAQRHMQIIPEIDMPGHTNAASVSYPFLNGNGKTVKSYTGTRVGFSTFDTQKDTVYHFLDDVIREISAISPSPYFHMGGDESHVTKKRDYILFVEKVEQLIQKHGKTMVGWEEIAQANIDSTSVSQFWRESKNALKAQAKGNKLIFSPAKKAYLDMKYDSISKHGLNWAGYIPVDTAYIWNPENYVEGLSKKNILGLEVPLWSETISNSAELEYLAFPRAIGYSELGWTALEQRNWGDYKKRLQKQQEFLEQENVNFYRTELVAWDN